MMYIYTMLYSLAHLETSFVGRSHRETLILYLLIFHYLINGIPVTVLHRMNSAVAGHIWGIIDILAT